MSVKFIYFDFGNVVLQFSNDRACRQIGELVGLPPERVRAALYTSGLKARAERGELNATQLFDEFCSATGTRPDRAAWERAYDDIFELNLPVAPLLAHLEAAGWQLGMLSNICETHWRYVSGGKFGLLPSAFRVFALSYEVGAMKPDPRVYQAAAELADTPPDEIFFVDDMPGHVAAAREAGFDAVPFTTAAALLADLRQRGVRSNY